MGAVQQGEKHALPRWHELSASGSGRTKSQSFRSILMLIRIKAQLILFDCFLKLPEPESKEAAPVPGV